MSRITQVKHILATVPVYMLMATNIPNTVLFHIEKLMCTFLCKGGNGNDRRHWINWGKCSQQAKEPWYSTTYLIQRASILKAAWDILTGDILWAQFCLSKYHGVSWSTNHLYPFDLRCTSTASYWKRIWHFFPDVLKKHWCRKLHFWGTNWSKTNSKAFALQDEDDLDGRMLISDILSTRGWVWDKLQDRISKDDVNIIYK